MAVNKVVYNGNTLVDLTADTASEDKVASGVKFHDASGTVRTGTLSFRTIYTGTSAPASSFGNENDIYIVTG